MITREEHDWGVKLTTRPFSGRDMQLAAEISHPKPSKGVLVTITFSGTQIPGPLKIVEAQTWVEALRALIDATRATEAEMREAAKDDKGAKDAKKGKSSTK